MEIISGVVSQYLSLSLYIKKQFVHVYCDVDSKQVYPHLTLTSHGELQFYQAKEEKINIHIFMQVNAILTVHMLMQN